MNKPLYSFLFFFLSFNLYVSQSLNNLEYLFDGDVKLENTVEEIFPVGNTDNGLFVVINIKDKNYKFLVDTGASVSILDEQTFKDIVDTKKKIIKIQDFVGNEEGKDLYYLDFKIGNNQFSNFAFTKFDLSKFFKSNCSKYDGILGANVLKKLNWKYVKKEDKLFFSKTSFTYEGFNKPAQLQWYGNVPAGELKINEYKFLALIDTGYFGTIIIPEFVYIKEFGVGSHYNLVRGKVNNNSIYTVTGGQKIELRKETDIENLNLDNYDFSKYEVVVAKMKPNIGNRIILENGFIFNFLKNEIAFGVSEEKSRFASIPKINICKSETNKNQIELCFFWNEPVNKMLKLHDQVIKIDSMNTTNVDDSQYCNLLDYLNSKKNQIKITFKRGNKEFDYILD
jgi:predicted aspartyl protease